MTKLLIVFLLLAACDSQVRESPATSADSVAVKCAECLGSADLDISAIQCLGAEGLTVADCA